MFTGIIEKKVKIKKSIKKNNLLEIVLDLPYAIKTKIGDSISVAGCCLTVYKKTGQTVYFQVIKETLEKTIFGKKIPKEVNIEHALVFGDKLGGHILTGHIDCVGVVKKIAENKNEKDITVSFPKKFTNFIIDKGSVAVDGISLTVSKCNHSDFTVSLIPHTLKITTLGTLKKGDCVNLEFDIVSKHIVKLIKKPPMQMLRRAKKNNEK